VGAIAQRCGGVGPRTAAVGRRRAKQGGAVIDLDRAVGLGRTGQRHGADVGDVVAHHAAVGRERGDARCHGRYRIDRDRRGA
jgi:hypothetical protein